MPLDLSQAFRVLSTDGKVGGTFQQGVEWDVQTSKSAGYDWTIAFDDHNNSTDVGSIFSFITSLKNANPADSVHVYASIDYYAF